MSKADEIFFTTVGCMDVDLRTRIAIRDRNRYGESAQ